MKRYIAIIHKDKDSDYGVVFPQFPGCVSAGDTYDEAVQNAAEALALHVTGMRADGEAIPTPRDFDDLKADKKVDWVDWKNGTAALVPLVILRGKSVKLMISMDQSLVDALDRMAKRRGTTRSGLLQDAAEDLLAVG